MKFYKCEICGKIVAMVKETPVDTMCCGQAMRELVPGTTDGATEKHVPVYTLEGNTVKVKVGSVEHPMTDAHHIEWIAIETENGNQRKELKPGDKPEATFALVPLDKVKSVYEYCNLHGLWKT
ncbi:MAG: desulfoferrodoxin [bacterium]|nr:desulfoferrodoxin [Candidatus Colisoma equi]